MLVTGGSGFIGTNLMELLLEQKVEVLNLDWNPPLNSAHAPWWRDVDLMDQQACERQFHAFKPTHVGSTWSTSSASANRSCSWLTSKHLTLHARKIGGSWFTSPMPNSGWPATWRMPSPDLGNATCRS